MKTKSAYNKQFEIFIILAFSIFSITLWDSLLIYPIKFFVVLLHEISHSIMTIITGGKVNEIFISFDLGGSTLTSGGHKLLIASAGYLGSLIFGAVLFIAGYNKKHTKLICTIVSIIILLHTIGYIQYGTQIVFALSISLFLFFLPRYFNTIIFSYILKFIGLTSSLYVLSDIMDDLITTSLRETDAQAIEFITGIPSLVIGIIWLSISIVIIYFLIRYSFKKGITI